MKNFAWFTAIFVLLISPYLWADKEETPYPYVVATNHGKFYFKMIPDQEAQDKGHGILYKVKSDGPDEVIWQVSGWYAFRVYLPEYNLEYLVRMGNWPRGNEPSSEHLAIAFYHKGNLIKSYSTKDLIKNADIPVTKSHYEYLKEVSGFSPGFLFKITTSDNIEYVFNVSTGEIISQKEKSAHKKEASDKDKNEFASIGTASMKEDGTIVLMLRAESHDGSTGDAMFSYPPSHPEYKKILKHLGGIEKGQIKQVPPWPKNDGGN